MKIALCVLCLFGLLSAKQFNGFVIKVVDGDTINILSNNNENLKVRILFIDTPEKYGGAKLEKDSIKSNIQTKKLQELGKASSSYANYFFKKGDFVQVFSDAKDQYGRLLGVVFKNNINYSAQIIKDGYSCIYKKAPYPKELQQLLISAKNQKVGLWKNHYPEMEALCH